MDKLEHYRNVIKNILTQYLVKIRFLKRKHHHFQMMSP